VKLLPATLAVATGALGWRFDHRARKAARISAEAARLPDSAPGRS